jgi:hypothetical protein
VITAKSVGSAEFITAYSRDRSHQATVNASVNPRAAIEATYDASEHLNTVYATYNAGLLSSRYVFYADSTFALQFNSATFGPFEYGGHFVRTNAGIKLNFDGWNVVGPWEASGIMNADALTVTYNSSMSLSDFIDGVYVLSRMP